MDLAAKLQECRLAKGWTQLETAERLGVSRRQYIYYETGHIPPVWQLKKLNELFNYDFSTLIYNQDELTRAKKTIERLQREVNRLKKQLYDRRVTER